MIAPPMNRASAVTQSKVVAVPKSTTRLSAAKSSTAASTLTIRSAPTVSGSSTSRVTGSGERASTATPVQPVDSATPSTTLWVVAGATEARQTARTSLGEWPPCTRNPPIALLHSSGVRSGLVVRRQWASSSRAPEEADGDLGVPDVECKQHERSYRLWETVANSTVPLRERISDPASRPHQQRPILGDPRDRPGYRLADRSASQPVAAGEPISSDGVSRPAPRSSARRAARMGSEISSTVIAGEPTQRARRPPSRGRPECDSDIQADADRHPVRACLPAIGLHTAPHQPCDPRA